MVGKQVSVIRAGLNLSYSASLAGLCINRLTVEKSNRGWLRAIEFVAGIFENGGGECAVEARSGAGGPILDTTAAVVSNGGSGNGDRNGDSYKSWSAGRLISRCSV
jgi:hypothetical protein